MLAQIKKLARQDWFLLLAFSIIYLIVRLIGLTVLPVFADESIYIRWSQLIIEDPSRYAFFPLNDGKTPLQMWLMVPLLLLFKDPLFAGRLLSVLVGWGQMIILFYLIKELGGGKKAQIISLAVSIFLPYWFFYQRFAITEALLALFFTLTIYFTVRGLKKKQFLSLDLILAGLSLGLGFWTKIPAVLFLPTLFLLIFISFNSQRWSWRNFWFKFGQVASIAFLGGLIFLSLYFLSPAFPQLFSRGGDFLIPFDQIPQLGLSGLWENLTLHLHHLVDIFSLYYGWLPLVALPILAFVLKPTRRSTYLVFFLGAAAIILPIALLGQGVYPRYYLPALLPLSIVTALSAGDLLDLFFSKKITARFNQAWRYLILGVLVLSALNFAWCSWTFVYPSWTDAGRINFTDQDQKEYLDDWSAGFGILETVVFIQAHTSPQQTALVLTEGYFGTLPDALNMYFFNQPVDNFSIQGIGAPVVQLPEEMKVKAADFDQTWLVVNSHRLQINPPLPRDQQLAEFCRPHPLAPCLQIWDVSSLTNIED